ncbi:uncharacterized protein [Euphorbia lathyris]|uniref:uncharacterized protein n=1 Tax=Euphorbia lathyris TaxID=212925 RepID=UPI003313AD65
MSWLFKSLQSDDPEDFSLSSSPDQPPLESPIDRGGVKEDLSVIGESIGRQLRGVANFLAPPPSPPSTTDNKSQLSDSFSSSTSTPTQSQALLGVRKDLAEIGGSFKSGLSLLSSNRAVSEISKLTSSLLQFQSNDNEGRDDDNYDYDCEDDYIPGITDEVMNFVKEITVRPECWTDFPLSLEADFKMSDAQREHASTVEDMVPSLTALRANLQMGDEQFWLIYFILVLPRMNEEDLEILSSQEIVETRSRLLQKLQNTRNMKVETSVAPDASHEDISYQEKEVTEIVNETGRLQIDDEENAEQWLKEAEIDPGTSLGGKKKLENEDDVSFSDLEDEENDLSSRLSDSGQVQHFVRTPSPSGSSDWVQLNESCETQGNLQKARLSISREKDSDAESNDWLKVDDSE